MFNHNQKGLLWISRSGPFFIILVIVLKKNRRDRFMKTEKTNTIIYLGIGFGLVLALITVLVLIDAGKTSKFENSLSHLYSINHTSSNLTHEMINSMAVISQETRTILLLEDPEAKQESYRRIEKARVKCDEAFANLKNMEDNADGQALLARLGNALNDYNIPNDILSGPALAGGNDKALPQASLPGTEKINEALKEVVRYQENYHKMVFEETIKDYRRWHMFMLLLGGLTLATGAMTAFLFARSQVQPEKKHTALADNLSPEAANTEAEAATSNDMKIPSPNIKGAQKKDAVDPKTDTSMQSDEDIVEKNLRAILKTGASSGVRPLRPPS